MTMQVGEHSNFKLKGSDFLETSGNHPLIKKDSSLILEIELAKINDYQKPKWELNASERLVYSMDQKLKGNDQFKSKNFKEASEMYEDGY